VLLLPAAAVLQLYSYTFIYNHYDDKTNLHKSEYALGDAVLPPVTYTRRVERGGAGAASRSSKIHYDNHCPAPPPLRSPRPHAGPWRWGGGGQDPPRH
jgi:hypothetical protein